MASIASLAREAPALKDIEQETVDYVRRHYAELRQAGLTSWTFDEFLAFCRPFTAHRRNPVAAPLRAPAIEKAEQLASALSRALERKYGRPLSEETRRSIVAVACDAIVRRNRSRIRLV